MRQALDFYTARRRKGGKDEYDGLKSEIGLTHTRDINLANYPQLEIP